jgi:DNA topoisomerase 2-associated protein PAT1
MLATLQQSRMAAQRQEEERLQEQHEQQMQRQLLQQHRQQQLLQQQQLQFQQQQQLRTPPPRMLPTSQSPRFLERQRQILLLQQQQELQQQQRLQELQEQLQMEELERQLRAQQLSQMRQSPSQYIQRQSPNQLSNRREPSGPTLAELQALQMRERRQHSPGFNGDFQMPLQQHQPHLPQGVQVQQRLLSDMVQADFIRDMQGASQAEQDALRAEAMRKIMEAERMEDKRRRRAAKIAHMVPSYQHLVLVMLFMAFPFRHGITI